VAGLHQRGWVHGDVRPANLTVGPAEGEISLLAPGTSARRFQPLDPGQPAAQAHYLAPEVIRGSLPTPASDVYSLGVVTYEAATGVVPFDGKDAHAVAAKHLQAAPNPPSSVAADVPAALDAAVLRALDKEPGARFAGAADMAAALSAATGAEAPATGPPKRTGLWVVLGIVAVVLLAAIVLATANRNATAVPELAGLTFAEAQQELAEASLVLGRVSYQPEIPAGVEQGTVVAQSPGAGERARKDEAVDITLAGRLLVKVPQLVGLKEAEVGLALNQAGLELGQVIREPHETVPVGTVTAQSAPAGQEIPAGSAVDLTVSTGVAAPQTAAVPDLVGRPRGEAERALSEAGFAIEVLESYDDQAPQGQVIRQAPPAGTQVETGSTVTIGVSRGPTPFVEVPSVIGITQAEAAARLEQASLQAKVITAYSDARPAGQIDSQTPPAGVIVSRGAAIAVVVSQGPPPPDAVDVPDVSGQNADEATRTLEEAGFAVQIIEVYSENVAQGQIVGQAPAANTPSPPGATVTIAVSQGPPPEGAEPAS